MTDETGSSQGDNAATRPNPSWISRRIRDAKRNSHQRRTEKEHQSATDRASRSTARATWAIAILTFATIGVGISQWIVFSRQLDEMRTARESSDRAWIAPGQVKMIGQIPITLGTPTTVQIAYQNSGKTPASGFSYFMRGGTLEFPQGVRDFTTPITFPTNDICSNLVPTVAGRIVYPSAMAERVITHYFFVESVEMQRQIISAQRILFIQGCFAYRSGSETHHSGYCYFLNPEQGRPPEEWQFANCTDGNSAD